LTRTFANDEKTRTMSYPIIEIPLDAREDTEQLGSKPKFWVLLETERWLFKDARPDTGEDWAEKAAAELASAVGIRAAAVELAAYGERRGCISRNFVDVKRGQALVHGNESLGMRMTGYDKGKTFRQSDHTLFKPSLERVAALSRPTIQQIIESLPDQRASPLAKQFAKAMIFSAQASLTEILK